MPSFGPKDDSKQESKRAAQDNLIAAAVFMRKAESILDDRMFRIDSLTEQEFQEINNHIQCAAAHRDVAIELLRGEC